MKKVKRQNKFLENLKSSVLRLNKSYKKFTWNNLASHLKISKSYLSQILSNKKPFPVEMLDPLIDFLDLDDLAQSEMVQCYFEDEQERLKSNSKYLTKFINKTQQPYTYKSKIQVSELGVQSIDIFDRWYYTAILDLINTKNFKMDFDWISSQLQLPKHLIEIAWSYLVSKEYIVLNENKEWIKSNKKFRIVIGNNAKSNEKELLRTRYNYYSQFMELAKNQILSGNTTKPYRLIQGVTCSSNSKNFDKVKLQLTKSLYAAANDLSEGDCDNVYFLMSIAIPLTKK